MQKYLKFLLFFVSILSLESTYAFFDGDMGIDIYKGIDEGLTTTQRKNYTYEITAQGDKTISGEYNRILRSQGLGECLVEGITINDIVKIKYGLAQDAYKLFKDECKLEDGKKIPVELFNQLIANVGRIDDIMIKKSQSKTKKTYEIAKIGLYSDGDTTNSPFDLIEDIKEIEKIIFSQKVEYNGVISDIDKDFDDLMKGVLGSKKNPGSSSSSSSSGGYTGTGSTGSGTWYTYTTYTPFFTITQTGSYVCSDTTTNIITSGLTEETITTLISGTGSYTGSGSSGSGSTGTGGYTGTGTGKVTEIPTTNYKKINDNSLWPCNEFFCIKIEFVIKNYKLLTGGKTMSIESILKKSNEHLKKFANTSLVQSKMTQNNFELGFMNLKLPDIFHMGIQIQKRTPPILNIEKNETREDKTEFTCDNMHTEYYKNLGLEYKRQNDIANYKKIPDEYKSLEMSEEQPFVTLKDIKAKKEKKDAVRAKQNEHFTQTIISRSTIEDSDIQFKEYIELEKFGAALRDYVFGISGIIKGMDRIPIKD